MSIRVLTADDATAFRAIRIEATQEAPTTVHPTEAEETARPLADFQKKLMDPNNRLFGAFQDDRLVDLPALCQLKLAVHTGHRAAQRLYRTRLENITRNAIVLLSHWLPS